MDPKVSGGRTDPLSEKSASTGLDTLRGCSLICDSGSPFRVSDRRAMAEMAGREVLHRSGRNYFYGLAGALPFGIRFRLALFTDRHHHLSESPFRQRGPYGTKAGENRRGYL